jgi:hypothetical protein
MMRQNGRLSKLLAVADETGKELANLYMRGVNEGYNGELMDENAQTLLDILDVFGEDGVRTYLTCDLEGTRTLEKKKRPTPMQWRYP